MKAAVTNNDHWQPRIGSAYHLTKNTVLRGGFGIYYLPEELLGGAAGFAQDTPLLLRLAAA